jgi:S-adenosylmethionine:diacylglycerol 3-amino-3-carboxypropyl transferase
MRPLFDFGLSQEDPLTEQNLLEIQPFDRILSVASGGEVPLSLLSLNDNISITAVDLLVPQIMLCRLKLVSALNVDFPLNGQFLGYSPMKRLKRREIFEEIIKPELNENEIAFWEHNFKYIETGVVGSGRFERYIKKMRYAAWLIIGKQNLLSLIACKTQEEQNEIFHKLIATRKSLHFLFKIAFHPKLYKKRGLQEQALIHARKDTGERFYKRFEDFCTGNLASTNYFLQYFLTGKCTTDDSYPEYLQPHNRSRLLSNLKNLELKPISFQEAIREKGHGFFNKIHFSNLGDWMESDNFSDTMQLLKTHCPAGTKICYRYLQKDHLPAAGIYGIIADRSVSEAIQKKDRFPFYTTYLLTIEKDQADI